MDNDLKEIKVIIGEEPFNAEDTPAKADGYADLKKNAIFLKKPAGNVLLHELIHLLDFDERTKPAITEMFNSYHIKPLKELMKQPDFLEYVSEYFSNYKPEDWECEVCAFHLEDCLIEDFNGDTKEAINYLSYFVWKNTGIYISLFFNDIYLDCIKLQ